MNYEFWFVNIHSSNLSINTSTLYSTVIIWWYMRIFKEPWARICLQIFRLSSFAFGFCLWICGCLLHYRSVETDTELDMILISFGLSVSARWSEFYSLRIVYTLHSVRICLTMWTHSLRRYGDYFLEFLFKR